MIQWDSVPTVYPWTIIESNSCPQFLDIGRVSSWHFFFPVTLTSIVKKIIWLWVCPKARHQKKSRRSSLLIMSPIHSPFLGGYIGIYPMYIPCISHVCPMFIHLSNRIWSRNSVPEPSKGCTSPCPVGPVPLRLSSALGSSPQPPTSEKRLRWCWGRRYISGQWHVLTSGAMLPTRFL